MDLHAPKLLESSRVEKLAALFLLVASIFVALIAVDSLVGLFEPRPPVGTMITVDGEGKVTAIPDIATITFSVSEDGDNASTAQDTAAKKINVALALIKGLGIEDRDVKTTSYSISPKYSYIPPCYTGYCPQPSNRIIGYTAAQTIEVKVRKTADAGKVLSQLGDAGVSNLYGPNFTIDDMDGLRAEARAEAINAARMKAKTLARDLGVSLVRVTGFYESGGPIFYGYGKAEAGFGGDVASPNVPSLPTGENEIVVNVTVSYEIR
jgi:hypothetical protein